MMLPDEELVIIEMAEAADDAVETVDPAISEISQDDARKYLSNAIGRLKKGSDKKRELQERLINRLLGLGGAWYREAQRQVIQLDPENSEGLKWMALALAGQVFNDVYTEPSPSEVRKSQKSGGYWEVLSLEKVGGGFDQGG